MPKPTYFARTRDCELGRYNANGQKNELSTPAAWQELNQCLQTIFPTVATYLEVAASQGLETRQKEAETLFIDYYQRLTL